MAHKNSSNLSPYKGQKKGPLRGRHRKPQKIFSFSEADDRLHDLFRNHGYGHIPHDVRHQFARFYQLMMKQQGQENFTRLLTIKDIGIKHFLDSIMVADLVPLEFPLLDLGTGPGFPGIPLRILCPPDKKIILAEGVQKRVNFLKKIRSELHLKNLDIIGRHITGDFHYPVQSVITRAVEDIRNTLTKAFNCLPLGGWVYFMKGPNVDPEVAMAKQTHGSQFKLVKDLSYEIPNTPHKRRLLAYQKITTASSMGKDKSVETEFSSES